MLARGDEGKDVLRLQEKLRALSVPIQDSPGQYGLWTEAALYVLQHHERITPDGIYGPQTAEILSSSSVPACFSGPPIEPLYVLEQVPYLSQRDNAHEPHSTCNVTALAMAMTHAGTHAKQANKQLEDELFELLRSEESLSHYKEQNPDLFAKHVPANQVYDNLVWAASLYGFVSSFSGKRSFSDIENELKQGHPVILSSTLTASGHVILLCGLTATQDLVCHDPYGDFHSGYKNRDGAFRIYPRHYLKERIKETNSEEKWALFLALA